MASDLKSREGAAIRASALKARIRLCTSGRLSQGVPGRFQTKATASRRRISAPRLAMASISPAIALNTAGLL